MRASVVLLSSLSKVCRSLRSTQPRQEFFIFAAVHQILVIGTVQVVAAALRALPDLQAPAAVWAEIFDDRQASGGGGEIRVPLFTAIFLQRILPIRQLNADITLPACLRLKILQRRKPSVRPLIQGAHQWNNTASTPDQAANTSRIPAQYKLSADTSESEFPMTDYPSPYAARLSIDYPETMNRLTTFFRIIWIIPIAIILGLISGDGGTVTRTIIQDESGEITRQTQNTVGGLASGLSVATALMIIVQQRYPRWWFDFARELTRFGYRVGAYMVLLTDRYPSTVEEQAVHLEIDYPDVQQDLNRWMPLVKWFLAIPHYLVLSFLFVGAMGATIIAWFAILATGQYPRSLFDFVVGVGRWALRVNAYVSLLVTDRYPPFSLN